MEINTPDNLEIRLFDMSGKLLYLNKLGNVINRLDREIDLEGVKSGLYHLHIKAKKGVYNQTLIVR
jgi:hypothetical protein